MRAAYEGSYSLAFSLRVVRLERPSITTTEHDGHDRPVKTRLPLPTKGAAASSTTDYVQLTYDGGSRITQQRLRDGSTLTFTYDNLSRVSSRTPTGEATVN